MAGMSANDSLHRGLADKLLEGQKPKKVLYALRALFTDGCTYANYELCGIFENEQQAGSRKTKAAWRRKYPGQEPEEFVVTPIYLNEVL